MILTRYLTAKCIPTLLVSLTMFTSFTYVTPDCLLYIKAKDHPLYWYAFNESLPILSKISKTIWQIETPSLPFEPDSISIKVHNSSDTTAIGRYMCIEKKGEVRLCVNSMKKGSAWLRSFEVEKQNGAIFELRTLINGLYEDRIHLAEANGSNPDGGYQLDLAENTTLFGLTWQAEVIDGCYGIFLPQRTKTRVPPRTTTIPTIITKATTINIDTTEAVSCVHDISYGQNHHQSRCFKPGSAVEVIKIIQEEIANIDHFFANGSTNVETQSKVEHTKETLKIALKIEKVGIEASKHLRENKSISVKTDDIDMTIRKQRLPFIFPEDSNSNQISVSGNQDVLGVVGIVYENLHEDIAGDIVLEVDKEILYKINSRVITSAVSKPSSVQSVKIVLQHLYEIPVSDTVCAFWNFTKSNGVWSTDGCKKLDEESTRNSTVCLCSHLTNFAILMKFTKFHISDIHNKILSNLSLVCSCISIFFLFIGILLFTVLLCGAKKHSRHIIHMNLMVSLFVAQLIFVTGITAVENKMVCQSVAYLLHYFFLASFSWMLVEGLYLYFAVIKVFSDGKIYMRWYFLIAWGFPAVVVLLTGSLSHKWYGTEEYCWLSADGYSIWAFIVPVLFIVLVNMIILVLIIIQIVKLAKSGGVKDDVKTGLRSSLILLPILGVTWIFGVLSFNTETIAFQYIFNITNSLQGFLITLFNCFFNTEVRDALKRRIAIWTHTTSFGKHFTNLKAQQPSIGTHVSRKVYFNSDPPEVKENLLTVECDYHA